MKKLLKCLSMLIIFMMLLNASAYVFITPSFAASLQQLSSNEGYYSGHYYRVYNESLNWEEAKTFCENMGGYLATVDNQQEQDLLTKLVQNTTQENLFIGGRRNESGEFSWITGEPFEYTNWEHGEPNNVNENYLMIFSALSPYTCGSWNDTTMHGETSSGNFHWSKYGFICEWDNYDSFYGGNSKPFVQPFLSAESAEAFIYFLFNNPDLNPDTIRSSSWYKIMTNSYNGDQKEIEIEALISYAISATDAMASESSNNMNFLNNELIGFFERELNRNSGLAEEIINEYQNEASKKLTQAIYDTIDNFFPTSVDHVFNVSDIFSAYDTITGSVSKAKAYTDRLVAGVEGVLYVLNAETAGRYSYFSSYLSSRGCCSSKDDPIFQASMAGNTIDNVEKNWFAKFSDIFSFITKKDSYLNHLDLIDEWAEYIYLLSCYCNQAFTETSAARIPESSLDYNRFVTHAVITGTYTDINGDVIIPETIDDKPVTHIWNNAFENCKNIESIIISENVTDIKENAFSGCDSLKSVKLSPSVTTIGENAFSDCPSLEQVYVTDNDIDIHENAFSNSTENLTFVCRCDNFSLIERCVQNGFEYEIFHQFSNDFTFDMDTIESEQQTMSKKCLYCDEKTDVRTISAVSVYNYVLVENPVPGRKYLIANSNGEGNSEVYIAGISENSGKQIDTTGVILQNNGEISGFEGIERYEWSLVKGSPEVQIGGVEYGPASYMFQNVETSGWLYNPVFETGNGANLSTTLNPVIDEYDPNSRIIFDSLNGAASSAYISNINNTAITQGANWIQFDTTVAFDPYVEINLHGMNFAYNNLLLTYHPNNISNDTIGRIYVRGSANNDVYNQSDSASWSVGVKNWQTIPCDMMLNGEAFNWDVDSSVWNGRINAIRLDYQDNNIESGAGIWVDSLIFTTNSFVNNGLYYNRLNSAWLGRNGLYPSHRYPWTQFANDGSSKLTSGELLNQNGIVKSWGSNNTDVVDVNNRYKYFYGWKENEFCRQWESTENLTGVYYYEKRLVTDAFSTWEKVTSPEELTNDGVYLIVDSVDCDGNNYFLEYDFTTDSGTNVFAGDGVYNGSVAASKVWNLLKVSTDATAETINSDDFLFYIQNVYSGNILSYDPANSNECFNFMPQATTGGCEFYGQEYLWKYDFEKECLVSYSVAQNYGEEGTNSIIGIEGSNIKANTQGYTCYILKKTMCTHINKSITEFAPASCETAGHEVFTCNACGYEFITILEPEHKYSVVTSAPTCTEKGFSTYSCTECGNTSIGDYVDATGHNFDTEFTIDIEPTETTAGQMSRHCLYCDEVTGITEIPVLEPIVKPGDVNGDGRIKVNDLLFMKKYISGEDVDNFVFNNADIETDGKVNVRDLRALKTMMSEG